MLRSEHRFLGETRETLESRVAISNLRRPTARNVVVSDDLRSDSLFARGRSRGRIISATRDSERGPE